MYYYFTEYAARIVAADLTSGFKLRVKVFKDKSGAKKRRFLMPEKRPSFKQFVSYVLEQSLGSMDDHWGPQWLHCNLCRWKFQFPGQLFVCCCCCCCCCYHCFCCWLGSCYCCRCFCVVAAVCCLLLLVVVAAAAYVVAISAVLAVVVVVVAAVAFPGLVLLLMLLLLLKLLLFRMFLLLLLLFFALVINKSSQLFRPCGNICGRQ